MAETKIPGLRHWPMVRTHEQASCYRQECQRPIGPARVSGFAVGHGAYVAYCPVCNTNTWYDLSDEVTAKRA